MVLYVLLYTHAQIQIHTLKHTYNEHIHTHTYSAGQCYTYILLVSYYTLFVSLSPHAGKPRSIPSTACTSRHCPAYTSGDMPTWYSHAPHKHLCCTRNITTASPAGASVHVYVVCVGVVFSGVVFEDIVLSCVCCVCRCCVFRCCVFRCCVFRCIFPPPTHPSHTPHRRHGRSTPH